MRNMRNMRNLPTTDPSSPMRPRAWRPAACLLVVVVLAAASGAAGCRKASPQGRVLCFGDSITAWYKPTDWPSLLAAERPDLEVVNSGVPGRTTVDGLAQFDEALQRAKKDGPVSDVVVLLGINDLHLLGGTARETAERLRQLAARIRQAGAREWLLTLTPANKIPLRRELPARQFSREVGTWLHRLNESGTLYTIVDLWETFEGPLDWSNCSKDGLHPDNEDCRRQIARVAARALPQAAATAASDSRVDSLREARGAGSPAPPNSTGVPGGRR